jgi:hypothetical protein
LKKSKAFFIRVIESEGEVSGRNITDISKLGVKKIKMERPIIFFSHSSKDKIPLAKLKELILNKCNNSIDIFLSSDGQSIPFGKNWEHQIEEALNKSTTFFIFLTPNSLNSQWVYFEAGHAYSRKRDVVPIGIFGLDLNSLKPPLNLLQGFNINGKEGLNNIISIINKNYDCSFSESFESKEFLELLSLTQDYTAKILENVFDSIIIDFTSELGEDYGYCQLSETFLKDFKNYLSRNNIEFKEFGDFLNFEGAVLKTVRYPSTDLYYSKLVIDPLSFLKSIELLKMCIMLAYNDIQLFNFKFYFNQNITCLPNIYQMSSRLMKYNCHLTDKNDFEYKNIGFNIKYDSSNEIQNSFVLQTRIELEKLNIGIINELIDVLFQSGVCVKV